MDQPVDAGEVIDELLGQIAAMHRELAVLRVQLRHKDQQAKPVIQSETPQ